MRGDRRVLIVRERIEDGFGRWAAHLCRHPWMWLLGMTLLAIVMTTRIPLIEIETSTEDYLFDSDPAKIAYDDFRDQFGRDQPLWVMVEPPEVFDVEFLEALVALHRDFEDSVPHLSEVTSLYNVRSVYGLEDELVVDDLLEEMPRSEEELEALRLRVMSTPAYVDSVISRDERVVAIVVEANAYSSTVGDEDALAGFEDEAPDGEERFLSTRETTEFCRAVLEVVERHRQEGVAIHLTGQPILAYALTRAMAEDVPRIFGGAMSIIALSMVVLFRRFSPVPIALVVVVFSLAVTFGLSELLGIPVSLPTQILPSFVLAVGVGYVVHVLTLFFGGLAESGDRKAAIEGALRHAGLPILLTAITTAAGLLSFVVAEMEQVAQLGVLGAIGVSVTLVYSLVFLPALLAILPLRPGSRAGAEGGARLLTACARLSVLHPRRLIAATLVLAGGAIALLPALDYSADAIRYFPEDHWLRRATEYADVRMGGMQSLELIVDTGRDDGIYDPEVMAGLEGLRDRIDLLRSREATIGRTSSVLEILEETHQALNENRPEFYRVPRDRSVIAQELLLFENSGNDDLEEVADSRFRKARMTMRTTWQDGVEKARFLDRVGPEITSSMEGLAEVSMTGVVALVARTAEATSQSLIRSYALALALITPLMILLIGSLRAGLISMVPNLVPVLVTLASMVVIGIDLDLFTLLGGCIAIGLAVDDSIHFIAGFRRHLDETGDATRAVELTMATTGRALLFTSIILAAGFAVLGLSSMANLAYLGLLTAFAIVLAFVLDVTVTPALLVLAHERKREGRDRSL